MSTLQAILRHNYGLDAKSALAKNSHVQKKIRELKNVLVVILGIGEYDNNIFGNLVGVSKDYFNIIHCFHECHGFDCIYYNKNNKLVTMNQSSQTEDWDIDYKLRWKESEIKAFIQQSRNFVIACTQPKVSYDGLIFFLSSHCGRENMIYDSNGKEFSVDFIFDEFDDENFVQFRNKPKIYFIDACRTSKRNPPNFEHFPSDKTNSILAPNNTITIHEGCPTDAYDLSINNIGGGSVSGTGHGHGHVSPESKTLQLDSIADDLEQEFTLKSNIHITRADSDIVDDDDNKDDNYNNKNFRNRTILECIATTSDNNTMANNKNNVVSATREATLSPVAPPKCMVRSNTYTVRVDKIEANISGGNRGISTTRASSIPISIGNKDNTSDNDHDDHSDEHGDTSQSNTNMNGASTLHTQSLVVKKNSDNSNNNNNNDNNNKNNNNNENENENSVRQLKTNTGVFENSVSGQGGQSTHTTALRVNGDHESSITNTVIESRFTSTLNIHGFSVDKGIGINDNINTASNGDPSIPSTQTQTHDSNVNFHANCCKIFAQTSGYPSIDDRKGGYLIRSVIKIVTNTMAFEKHDLDGLITIIHSELQNLVKSHTTKVIDNRNTIQDKICFKSRKSNVSVSEIKKLKTMSLSKKVTSGIVGNISALSGFNDKNGSSLTDGDIQILALHQLDQENRLLKIECDNLTQANLELRKQLEWHNNQTRKTEMKNMNNSETDYGGSVTLNSRLVQENRILKKECEELRNTNRELAKKFDLEKRVLEAKIEELKNKFILSPRNNNHSSSTYHGSIKDDINYDTGGNTTDTDTNTTTLKHVEIRYGSDAESKPKNNNKNNNNYNYNYNHNHNGDEDIEPDSIKLSFDGRGNSVNKDGNDANISTIEQLQVAQQSTNRSRSRTISLSTAMQLATCDGVCCVCTCDRSTICGWSILILVVLFILFILFVL